MDSFRDTAVSYLASIEIEIVAVLNPSSSRKPMMRFWVEVCQQDVPSDKTSEYSFSFASRYALSVFIRWTLKLIQSLMKETEGNSDATSNLGLSHSQIVKILAAIQEGEVRCDNISKII